MTKELHPLYAARIWQMGKSVVFPLYAAVMEAIGAKAGDLVLVRVHPPYVTFRVANPKGAVPTEGFDPAELPPLWPGRSPKPIEEGE